MDNLQNGRPICRCNSCNHSVLPFGTLFAWLKSFRMAEVAWGEER